MIIKLMADAETPITGTSSLLENQHLTPLDLETYLARSLAISLLALAFSSLTLSGVIPVSTSESENRAFASPVTLIATFYHFATAFLAYGTYNFTNQTAYALGMIGSGIMAAAGVWCLLFAGDSHISKRTGKDKRTSGWPFGDKKARVSELKDQ
jgi:hypothetical protein